MGKVVEPVVNVNEVSRVSSGTIIRGDIYSPNDIRIDGSFEGRIISKCKVVVGENAVNVVFDHALGVANGTALDPGVELGL